MINGHKVIGVCVTVVQNRAEADYVDNLRIAAHKQGYKVMVFNSVLDFYVNNTYADGAKSVYDVINFNVVDALVIISDTMYHCKGLKKDIIRRAQAKNVPVLLINDEYEGCYIISKENTSALTSVIDHVIREHGVTDTFFMAGRRTEDPYSAERIGCYKAALEMNGLEFSEDRLDYGDYWSVPTREVMKRLTADGKRPPRAIFCANDYMAIAVCEFLEELDYKVPEDCIVTGFGGVSDAEYFNPRLTTCREVMDTMAELTVDILNKAWDGMPNDTFIQRMEPVIAESCGCKNGNHYHSDAGQLFSLTREMKSHENHVFSWLDKMIDINDMNKLGGMFSHCIMPGSMLCLKDEYFNSDTGMLYGGSGYEDCQRLACIASVCDGEGNDSKFERYEVSEILPQSQYDIWLQDDTCIIITAAYVGSEVCGYYAVKTNNVYGDGHKINRLCKGINIALNSAFNQQRQLLMAQSIERANYINPVTKLPNLKGANKWFDEFSAVPENHQKMLAVSIYGVPKYKYIYDSYGLKDVEEAMRFVADALISSNDENCYIAHISEDEFVVINYFDDFDIIGDVIEEATRQFFQLNERYNSMSAKEYYVEVNCGCTVVDTNWDGNLASFTQLASGEMYMNRVKQGNSAVAKEQVSPKEYYDKFNTLITKNLFNYNFQPIVDARTGNIYAYEALMRTDPKVGMNPMEVLATAGEFNRMYDVEIATMFNVMERYSSEYEKFEGKKVFINSIPGYFLKENDYERFCEQFRQFLSNIVLEITEQNTITDEELAKMKNLGGTGESQIAVDDYGTGHSNIVNLLRYAPQIIKIDRYLITDIHKDVNKQMFVKSTIELARRNGIRVLAEGVETSQELRQVVAYGVDYIQGYYTGRPSPEPIQEIDERIRYEIINTTVETT